MVSGRNYTKVRWTETRIGQKNGEIYIRGQEDGDEGMSEG